MEFIEIKTRPQLEDTFEILKELVPELKKENFFESLNHDLMKNQKLFGITSSGKLVSVAAVWLLMNGLLEKFLWIHAFVTTKGERSKGFGQKLLLELEKYADREKFNEIRIHAHRERAIAFWENNAKFELFSHVYRKKIELK
ncbi:MAG: GNAT family N-acetyltransferase [Deltaproteobacteria bacterium]|nr:GNAT family N-acetyltransferase [Deltaproteobacteria bacterium]